MKSQFLKNLYYATLGKLSVVSFYRHKVFPSQKHRNAFVNIGCGENYVDNMVNIDGNVFRRKDIWLDLTLGLPFPDNSIRGVYASHVLEHFSGDNARRLLSEAYRVLCPGGGVRIVVPSLEFAIEAYTTKTVSLLPEWPEKHDSIGGRFNNFLLCANQHLLMFDFSFLEEILTGVGFREVSREKAHASRVFTPEHMRFEPVDQSAQLSLYVEGIK